MDSAPTASPPVSAPAGCDRRITRFGWLLIALAFVAYAVLLGTNMGAYAGGSDSSGYMNHARLLGFGHVHVEPRTIPGIPPEGETRWMYSALGFKPAPDGHGLVPTYPVGLPLLILATAKIVGWAQAGNVILWLHGLLGAALTYAAGRTFGLSRRTSVIAMVLLAGSPLYLFMTVQAMSDVPALVWTAAAIVAAWRSRARAGWALGAGAAYAMAVLIRPTNALALVPLAFALGFSWRRWVLFGLGGLPGAVLFALHSHAAYGKYLTTGYGDSAGLETRWIGPTLAHYGRWLPVMFSPAVGAFLGLPWLLRRAPGQVLTLASWALVYGTFYALYYFTHETWWYLRFMLPAAPALVIGSLLVLQVAFDRLRVRRVAATVLVCAGLAAAFAWDAHWSRKMGALASGKGEETYPRVAAWLNQHLPADAVVAAMQHSGALYYYTPFTFFRWDNVEPDAFARVSRAVLAAHRPLYAVLSPFEIGDQGAFTRHLTTGHWTQIGQVHDVTVWQWSADPAPAAP